MATILSKFRRCLCKKTAEGEAAIRYLNDTNSFRYGDESTADLTGAQGDVMVDFPEFYYKYTSISSSQYSYSFAEYNVDGTYIHVPRSLVGAYKGCVVGGKLYSRSGVAPTTDETFTDFETYSSNRGEGYQLIDFQQHCVIAFMLYAKYGNRNLQDVLGVGGAGPSTPTGTTNTTGNADTVSQNATEKYVCGLALEGVFGGTWEWTSGVSITDRVWRITDPDGTIRNITACDTDGWIKKIAAENGSHFDLIPTFVGGSETTYYADHYTEFLGGPFCLLRSYYSSNTSGGVAYAAAYHDASYSTSSVGARLAFRGVISEAASVAAFKALAVL